MKTRGTVRGIISNLVIIKVEGPVLQNEICFIEKGDIKLMAEVIRFSNEKAFAQVFESTRGLKTGALAEFTGHMLNATLGPGLLSKNFDGLQTDLDKKKGTFLNIGEYSSPLDNNKNWDFQPLASLGQQVKAGDWLGEVKENWIPHKIMVPFSLNGNYTLNWLAPEDKYSINDTIAVLNDEAGNEYPITMLQRWPVKRPIKAYKEKMRPYEILETGIRIIDSLNPLAKGGTGFIPGPFGCGKTVLQHLISKQANADLIIFVACGERANEVVEIFTDFPQLDDPRTGRKLIERTTIICNTSNMPVAAREASVYTGMTIAEYYRSMGLHVLLLADSTSRWAQALREMSNRLEELPGPDAFPMDLSAIISNYYSRAGMVYLNNNQKGSITFLGTVSPAGGNLKEPVAEGTKKAARCFYALSQKRADSKRYPAIDPVESYSKYIEYQEVEDYLSHTISHHWIEWIKQIQKYLLEGKEAYEQINILGDDGVPLSYHISFWKAEVIDFIFLQQDAFDKFDQSSSLERQKFMIHSLIQLCIKDFEFKSFEEISFYFKEIISSYKTMNYSEFQSDTFKRANKELQQKIKEREKKYA